MVLYLRLRLIFIAYLVSNPAFSRKNDELLEAGGQSIDLNQDNCDSGTGTCENRKENDDERALESDCDDKHKSCSKWASMGECDANPNYMLQMCMKSCNICMRKEDELFYLNAIEAYGVKQKAEGARKIETLSSIRKAVDYMKNHVHSENPTHTMSRHVIDSCSNQKELCAFWAVIGECDANPGYMLTNCAPMCQTCEKIDLKERCGERDPNEKPSLRHGELNTMFERIVRNAPGNQTEETRLAALEGKVQTDGTPYYTVNILSRPLTRAQPPDEITGLIPVDELRDTKESPWIITMDNFLTEEECDYLIEFGFKNGFERSRDVGGLKFDGSFDSVENTSRTSTNSWCDEKSGCRTDQKVQRIMERLSSVTQIPSDNFEDLQLLKYEVGQFYKIHHDYIMHQKERHCGPRILTFFLYLSDVEEAGGTGFADLGITVSPKKGRALLWPSVMNYDPSVKDGRTRHEALQVEKGRKFAANAWIHLYDYKKPQKLGCN